ncbi:hypothetical protein OHC33_010590 [Knufia fluminis]|uniref:Xylanolytic transcriptional activator regulatory domain-containing protein n=1 Tax=Knufia fluminis TaxID=191047 RepID=A0AAN8EYK6_9EURO|nr:hypothetical protein OHC33_010590 [Knufia fluminis]
MSQKKGQVRQGASDMPAIQQPVQHALPVEEDDSRKRRAVDSSYRDDDAIAPPAIKVIEQKLNQLTSLMHDINRLTPVSNGSSPGSSQYDNAATTSSSAAEDTSNNPFTLYGIPNATSVPDGAPWANVLTKLDQLNNLLRSGIKPQPRKAQESSMEDKRSAGQGQPSIEPGHVPSKPPKNALLPFGYDLTGAYSPETDTMAPTEEQSSVLFRSWLFSTYPIYPSVSPRLVLAKYEAFNQWYRRGMDKGEQNPDASFMPYLTLIWYTGYISLSDRAKDKWFPRTNCKPFWVQSLRGRLEHQLETMRSEATPSIWALAAAIIGQHLAIGGQNIVNNSICNMLIIRAAQSLGLHSEKTLKVLDATEAEMKRRLLWETISLDVDVSTVSGMPVVLDEIYTDTEMVSELKEMLVGTTEAQEYEAHLQEPGTQSDRPDDPASCKTSSFVSVYHLVAKARHILAAATKRTLKVNMSAQPMTMNELKELRKLIVRTSKEVHATISRIPCRGAPEFDFTPEVVRAVTEFDHLDSMGSQITEHEIGFFLRDHSSSEGLEGVTMHHKTATIAFHKWARITLSLLVDRLDCISYAPFLKNPKSRMWAVARNCALKVCHGFMRKFLSLAKDPELCRFRWAWGGTLHPMHATIIMLIDLHDRPHSDEAPRSRAMIDKMFSLASPEKGIVDNKFIALPLKEGGTEAWTMLRKLRHRTWQKAGLDPDVLWSEEDQISVGVGKPLSENDLFIRSLREDIILSHKQRRNRTGTESNAGLGHRNLFSGTVAEYARKQRLHPSELSPGDRVEGPIVRGLADLDIALEVPQILLLRASHNQELMPYPVEVVTNNVADHQQPSGEKTGDILQTRSGLGSEGAGTFHIGELIKKIRGSQPNRAFGQAPPTSTLSSVPGVEDQSTKDDCNFRNILELERVAYQDLQERRSAPIVHLINHNGDQTISSGGPTGPKFSDYPVPPGPTFNVPKVNGYGTQHITTTQQQHGTAPWNQTAALPQTASAVPTTNNFGYLGMMTWPQVSFSSPHPSGFGTQPHSQAEAQLRIPPEAVNNNPSNYLTNTNPNMDVDTNFMPEVDFDWDKWDEIFGQYGGFEDMLMGQSEDTTLSFDDWHAEAGVAHGS